MIGICGASGRIGYDSYELLKSKYQVIGTYFRHFRDGLIKFNVITDSFTIFDSCQYVIITFICGGRRNMFKYGYPDEELCEQSYLKTKDLLVYLDNKNINTIFISSINVETMDDFYTKYKIKIENLITNELKHSKFIRPGRISKYNVRKLSEEIFKLII